MPKNLVIVESPAKAQTISRFLGKDFEVLSSYGHMRDLPEKKMGIDTENDFKPEYVIPAKAKKNVEDIKKAAKKADMIYFATDEDREGEAIAWHLLNIIDTQDDGKVNDSFAYERIVFHEITEHAIKEAVKHPRKMDYALVDAQQARRILDRLVGYELSPFLWKKVAKGLSAGRVQSVAVRLIIEKEREIKKFKPQEYWSMSALLTPGSDKEIFEAKLHKADGKNLDKLFIKNEKQAKEIENELKSGKFVAAKVTKKKATKNPLAPFTTSTLQQEAHRRLGYSAKQTMSVAQKLYEGVKMGKEKHRGLITYMRTDSVNLSDKFITESREYIANSFGKEYIPEKPKVYKTKSKLSQEAHEAIRPTEASLSPDEAKQYLDNSQARLYELIWNRAMASQMTSAAFDATTIDVENGKYTLRSGGSIMTFDGYLKVYADSVKDSLLPDIQEGVALTLNKLNSEQKHTEPAARYSDASLVKKMEELGIGRPSTYAPTISTIINRGYVERKEKKFVPTDIAYIVNDLLVEHFKEVVDYQFTAKMEDDLDEIAAGKKKWQPIIKEFYVPFKATLTKKDKEIKKADLINEESDEVCEKCKAPMLIKTGRYGKFLACSAFPKCRNTKPLEKEGGEDGEGDEDLNPDNEKCPDCGKELVVKQSRFGKFLACSGYPDCKFIKNNFSTGVECNKCHQGKIMMRKTRRGRIFYGCSNYPNCDHAVWQRPIEDPDKKGHGLECPKCKSLIVDGGKAKDKCSNKECDYEIKKIKEEPKDKKEKE